MASMPKTVHVREQIAPGVTVMNINTDIDPYTYRTRVTVELIVSSEERDAVAAAMRRLSHTFAPDDDYVFRPPERQFTHADGNSDTPNATLDELRAHLDERLDDIDRALRLAVDP